MCGDNGMCVCVVWWRVVACGGVCCGVVACARVHVVCVCVCVCAYGCMYPCVCARVCSCASDCDDFVVRR